MSMVFKYKGPGMFTKAQSYVSGQYVPTGRQHTIVPQDLCGFAHMTNMKSVSLSNSTLEDVFILLCKSPLRQTHCLALPVHGS